MEDIELVFLKSGVLSFDDLTREISTEVGLVSDTLTMEERGLAALTALASKGYVDDFVSLTSVLLDHGMDEDKILELVLHVSMYAGVPVSTMLVRALRNANLLSDKKFDKIDGEQADLDRNVAGSQVKQLLHRERAENGYASSSSLGLKLYSVATKLLYGDLWMRKGLSIRERMICSIASFTALSLNSQQRKFFQSAGNVGLSTLEVVAVIGQTAPYSGFAPALAAIALVEEITPNSEN
ncbi:MAG: carboxymuconolactone decarboxylase family protein [Sneathiellales bacterium]|nr:carboxymuconolactone decarboxylase family protein [Sneathiellales bacterium]